MIGHVKVSVIQTIVVLAIAVAVGKVLLGQKKYPWHEGPQWERFLKNYDDSVAKNYNDCESKLIPTRFGATQVHGCGDISKPAVLFLHGARASSIMYSDWLIPSLRKDHYAVAVDFICDIGRSVPKDKNTANCPQNRQEMAEWLQEVVHGLSLHFNQVSLVGYSYGSFISACTALILPDLVDKLVLIAPAAVFAPFETSWLWMVLLFRFVPFFGVDKFFKYMSADPDFDMKSKDLIMATGACIDNDLVVSPEQFSDEALMQITSRHPTLLIIGREEKVTNATLAADTARRTGVQVQLFPRSGHLLMVEHPREAVNSLVESFLQSSNDPPM